MKHLYTQTLHNMAESLKTLRTYTIAGQAFVNECLQHIKATPLTVSTALHMLNTAKRLNDTKLTAWSNEHFNELEGNSLKTRIAIVCENLDASSPNQAAAIESAEEVVNTSSNDADIIKLLVIEHVLDKYNMYPEVAQLIALAKQQFSLNNDNAKYVNTHRMLVINDTDIIGYPATAKWYSLADNGALQAASRQPSENAAILMNAIQYVLFNYATNRFDADTVIGKVQIAGQDSILIDGNVIDSNAFVERVKQHMQLHGTAMDINGTLQLESMVANAVATVANNFNNFMLLENSIVVDIYAVYATNKFNLINIKTGEFRTFNDILETINYMKSLGVSSTFIDVIQSNWSILYEDALMRMTLTSGKLEAYQSTLTELNTHLNAVKSKQASMATDSEGYAAYQLIIDKYTSLIEQLKSKINDLTAVLAK